MKSGTKLIIMGIVWGIVMLPLALYIIFNPTPLMKCALNDLTCKTGNQFIFLGNFMYLHYFTGLLSIPMGIYSNNQTEKEVNRNE